MRAGTVVSTRGAWPATAVSYKVGGVTLHVGVPSIAASKATGFFWFPGLEKHADGRLIVDASLNADSNDNSSNTLANYRASSFAGPFAFAYNIDGFAAVKPLLSLPDGSIEGGEYNLTPVPNDQTPTTVFKCRRSIYKNDGTYAPVSNAVTVSGFPATVKPYTSSPTVFARISWFGEIIQITDTTWISQLQVMYNTDTKWTTCCIRSTDRGYNWTYIGEIGGPADVPATTEAFSEASMCRVPDGRVMAVSRTGTGGGDNFYRAYSSDNGVTWTTPDSLSSHPAKKSPQMQTLSNGVTVLIGGFPGLIFQFSLDSGATWSSSWNLMTHHNLTQSTVDDTVNSGYMAMQEVQSNRLAVVYDRYPTTRPGQPNDGSLGPNQIYLADILVNRA